MDDVSDAGAGDLGRARRRRRIAEGLEIDVERVRANLELSGGRIMTEAVSFALADKDRPRRRPIELVQELSQRADQRKAPAQGGAGHRRCG